MRYVLTADRSQLSNYRGNYLFGFLSCGPVKISPEPIYSMICPTKDTYDSRTGELVLAPVGLRRIQESLERAYGTGIVVAQHPFHLDKVIDEKTRVVGLTEMSPLGLGPVDTAISWKNDNWNRKWFVSLMKRLKELKKKFRFKVVVGGPGAWQLLHPFTDYLRIQGTPIGNMAAAFRRTVGLYSKHDAIIDEWVKEELGVDHVVEGEADSAAPEIFEKIEEGDAPEYIRVFTNSIRSVDDVPEITRPTLAGSVEIMRGCGRGCDFCAPNLRTKRDFPIERIVKEASVNIRIGQRGVWLLTEDLMLYGCDNKNMVPNEDVIVELYTALKKAGAWKIGCTHWTLAGVCAAPDLIRRLSEINELRDGWMGVQPGLEWISPHMIRKYMPYKTKPFSPEEYPEVVMKALKIMNTYHYYPAVTLIVGHPGEQDDEIEMTIQFIEDVHQKGLHGLFAPLLYVDYYRPERSMTYEKMNKHHWRLFYTAWKHNTREFSQKIWLATQNFGPLERLVTVIGTHILNFYILRFIKHQYRRRFGEVPNWMTI